MNPVSLTAAELYAAVVDALIGNANVVHASELPRGSRFGSSELRIDNRIFALCSADKLVVKLPRQRVDQLVATGLGERFDPRRDGRPMKEWVCIDPICGEEWLPLAREAMVFVGSKRP